MIEKELTRLDSLDSMMVEAMIDWGAGEGRRKCVSVELLDVAIDFLLCGFKYILEKEKRKSNQRSLHNRIITSV